MANLVYRRHQVDVFNPVLSDGSIVTIQTSPVGGGTTSPAGLTHRAYSGTTAAGSAIVGTQAFTSGCTGFVFFNKSSSTAVEISLDGSVWLPMGAYGSWEIKPPGGFGNASPFTEVYHRQVNTSSARWAISAWEA